MHTTETRLDRERQRRLARGVRSAPRRAAKIDPDARQAAEQCLDRAATQDERQFWERYLATGDHDSYTGFMPPGGEKAAGSAQFQIVIADLAKGVKRRGKLPSTAVRRGPRSLAAVIRSL